MNRLLKSILAGSVVAAGFTGCGLLDATEEETPTITIESIGSIDVGTFKNVEGEVEAGEAITSISYEITDDDGNEVSTITVSGPSSSSDDKIEFKDNNAIKITVSNSATAGDYKLKITVTAGSTVDASFNFSVSGSGGTALTEKTGTISNIYGPDKGAFNLVDGERMGTSDDDAEKDLMDLSLVGEGFAGELGSGNGTKFAAASAADYTSATDVSVKALAASASAEEIAIDDVGKVFVAKLGNSRGYAIVKITRYAPTEGPSTGENKGEADFSYKFTAN
ncbi:MAG: hypothetical protein JXA18_15090 [Chitinispirillaceae bacterium]|nr:hypothetical protein [Chitinispirillaceae bacterium]